jgi:hypothetical protein
VTDDVGGTGGQPSSGPPGVDASVEEPTPLTPSRWDHTVDLARRQSPSRLALAVGFALAFVALGMGIQHTIDGRVVVSAASFAEGVGSPDAAGPSLEPLTVSGPTDPVGSTASVAPDPPAPTLADSGDTSASAVAVHIPRLKLDRSLVDLHVLPDGSMSVPQDAKDVGWWAEGPHPGGAGATLVAGHVDSKTGPAVFYRLKDMVPGDLVTVDRADSTSSVFKVVDKVTYTRANFPDDIVYRVTGKPSLHLVTCDGFDPSIGHYGANLVVFAELVSSGPTGGKG